MAEDRAGLCPARRAVNAKAAAGQIRRLLVRADPALELLPATGPLAPVAQPRGSDPLQTYEIRWPGTMYPSSGAGPAASVDLHFLWSGLPSSGAFRVPQIEVVNARPVRRSLAVSVDPALEYQPPAARFRDSGPAGVHRPLGHERFAPRDGLPTQ